MTREEDETRVRLRPGRIASTIPTRWDKSRPGADGEVLLAPDTGEVLLAPDTWEVLLAPDTGEVLLAPDTWEVLLAPDTWEMLLAPDTKRRSPRTEPARDGVGTAVWTTVVNPIPIAVDGGHPEAGRPTGSRGILELTCAKS